MGQAHTVSINSQKYGVNEYEMFIIQQYFNTAAAIDFNLFNAIHRQKFNRNGLNVATPYYNTRDIFQSFQEADINRDGYITFDEFVQAYLKAKRANDRPTLHSTTLGMSLYNRLKT